MYTRSVTLCDITTYRPTGNFSSSTLFAYIRDYVELFRRTLYICTLIKKKTKFSIIYKEIQMGSGAKSFMRKGFLLYEEMLKFFLINREAVSH